MRQISLATPIQATIGTEKLRALKLGNVRNVIGAVSEIAKSNFRRAEVAFVKYRSDGPPAISQMGDRVKQDDQEKLREKENTKNCIQRANIHALSLRSEKDYCDLEAMDQAEVHENDQNRFEADGGVRCPLLHQYFSECFNRQNARDRPSYSNVDNVIHIRDNMLGIVMCNASHISIGYRLSKYTRTNSGFVDLLWLRRSDQTGRLAMLRHWIMARLKNKSGKADLQLPAIEVTKTECFKIEPLDTRPLMSIDGERVPNDAPVYCEVHPGLANVMIL